MPRRFTRGISHGHTLSLFRTLPNKHHRVYQERFAARKSFYTRCPSLPPHRMKSPPKRDCVGFLRSRMEKIGHAEIQDRRFAHQLADEFPEKWGRAGRRPSEAHGKYPSYVEPWYHSRGCRCRCDSGVRPVKISSTATGPGRFEDPFGPSWHIATHVEDVAPDEMHKRAPARPSARALALSRVVDQCQGLSPPPTLYRYSEGRCARRGRSLHSRTTSKSNGLQLKPALLPNRVTGG